MKNHGLEDTYIGESKSDKEQHLYYYQDGKIVSGFAYCFRKVTRSNLRLREFIFDLQKPEIKVLKRGAMRDGTHDYESPYLSGCRLTVKGIGLHDAF